MSLWRGAAPLVLASRSRARQAMLEAAGIPLEIRVADIDERALEAQSGVHEPDRLAALLARAKAEAVARELPDRLVLGADQTLALGSARYVKPVDRLAARAQLRALAGHTHRLYSALAVVRASQLQFAHVGVAALTMREVSDAYLDRYLDLLGPAVMSSVGGYQLEGLGVQLFEQIEGDHFTVLGLPLMALLSYLRREGWLMT
jgi:septum formation protein